MRSAMDGADIGAVRSDGWNGIGDGALSLSDREEPSSKFIFEYPRQRHRLRADRGWRTSINREPNFKSSLTRSRFKFDFTTMTVGDNPIADDQPQACTGPN